MRYAFILQHQETWPIAVLCEVLDVSRSGFYAYAHQQAAPQIDRDEVALLARVKAIHAETGQSYGSRRMAKQLQAEGFAGGTGEGQALHAGRRPGGAASHAAWTGYHRQSASLSGRAESLGAAV